VLEAFLGKIEHLDVHYRATGKAPNLKFDEWQATANRARRRPPAAVVERAADAEPADRALHARHHRSRPVPADLSRTPRAARTEIHRHRHDRVRHALRDVFRVPWNVLRFATKEAAPSPGIQRGAEEFARALHEGRQPPISAEDGRRPIALMESACAHKPMKSARASWTRASRRWSRWMRW
jgi:hypothetical protein